MCFQKQGSAKANFLIILIIMVSDNNLIVLARIQFFFTAQVSDHVDIYALTIVDPVKATLSTSGCIASLLPNAPLPVTTLNTPEIHLKLLVA